MKSRTQYVTDTMVIPVKDHENSRAAFDSVYSAYPFATNLAVVSMTPTKGNGAMVTVSFTKRVRLSKAQRMQA